MTVLRTNIAIRHKQSLAFLHADPRQRRKSFKLITSKDGCARFSEAAAKSVLDDLNKRHPDEFETVTLDTDGSGRGK